MNSWGVECRAKGEGIETIDNGEKKYEVSGDVGKKREKNGGEEKKREVQGLGRREKSRDGGKRKWREEKRGKWRY